MDLLQQIQNLAERINLLDDQSTELGHRAWDLRREREVLIARMILEEGLLKDSTWDVELGGTINNSGVYLSFTGLIDDGSAMKVVVDMARSDYHSSLSLSDGINIRFNDNDISLTFKESKMMLPFIQKYGLVINGTSIQDRLAKLKREIASLELVCHQFKL